MKTDSLKDRDYMYKLIIGQLFYDGYQQAAVSLAQNLNVSANPPPPSDKLFRLVERVKEAFPDEFERDKTTVMETEIPSSGLDLEFDADIAPNTPEPSLYETIYLTTHKQSSKASAFNADGTLVATGSADCSIKIMDVERIIARETGPRELSGPELSGPDAHHPVIRTLYDHIDEVNCLAFHPRKQILASGSSDFTLKFFDFSKASVKRAHRTVFEVEPIRAMSFHPTGDYLLIATQHPTLRLYDVRTAQCFVSPTPQDQHRGPLNDVSFSDSGRLYVSCSADGDVKIWDGVSSRCVETFVRAHDGFEVCSAAFTRNAKYVLTAGKDSVVKLWELASNRCLIAYTGAGATGPQENLLPARFNHTEDYVLFPDEKSGSLCSWDARNADRKRLLALGHTAPVRHFSHSPTQPAFVTCSDDFRVRFWYKKTTHEA